MDDNRKRYVVAGVIIGAVAVGLAVLAKRTPRDQWGSTLTKIAKDGLAVVKNRYGNNEVVTMLEKTLDRVQDGVHKILPGEA